MEKSEPIDHAITQLWLHRTIQHDGLVLTIACLIRTADWRPLRAPWWRGKDVSVIGADLDGNFFLRHCDGAVQYWNHKLQATMIIAPSIKEFVSRIE